VNHEANSSSKPPLKVLFVCIENAGRSQMAEAYAKHIGLQAMSAGTMPAKLINPVVVLAMKEAGIDITGNRPKLMSNQMVEWADLVVTMGCSVEEVCPAPLVEKISNKVVRWDIEDPKGKSIEDVRRIRNIIFEKVRELASSR
jgi:Protein-tyrosine-phosphatase